MDILNTLLEPEVIEKQLPISSESARRLMDVRYSIFNDQVNDLSAKVYTGELSIGSWEEQMKGLIRGVHSSAAAIGKGGWDNMTQSDWGKLGSDVKKQYRWLAGFAEDIETNKDTIALGQIQARARMYGQAAGASAQRMEAGDIADLLSHMPKDGSSQCLTNCKCRWKLDIIDDDNPKYNVVQATWELGEAEHCDDCVGWDGDQETIFVDKGVDVPDYIGGW